MFFFDPLYLLFALPGVVLALWAQMKVRGAFSTYSRVPTRRGLTGRGIAEAILATNGIRDVRVEPVQGFLSDHYDPRTRTLRLSPPVYQGNSIAAAGIAAHEVGHAIQHAEGYRWLQMRSSLVPVMSITSTLAMPTILVGFLLMSVTPAIGQATALLGVALFGFLVVFQLVTLPVELDASRRALTAIERGHLVTGEEYTGARKVLSAAALTYVAAAVSSLLTLLYFLVRLGVFSSDDR